MDPVSGGESIKTLIFCFKWSTAPTVNACISLWSFSQSFFIPLHVSYEIAHFSVTIIVPAALRSLSKTLRFCAHDEETTLDLVRRFKEGA